MYNDLIRRSSILNGLREANQSFREVMKDTSTDALDEWIKKFSKSSFHHIPAFAGNLQKDMDAVKNATTYSYLNGLTEGIINAVSGKAKELPLIGKIRILK